MIAIAFLLLLTSSYIGKPQRKQTLLSKWISRKMFAFGSEYILSYISSQTIYCCLVQYQLLFTPQLDSGLYKLQVEITSDEAICQFFGRRSQKFLELLLPLVRQAALHMELPRMLTAVLHINWEQHLHKAQKGLWLLPSQKDGVAHC